MNNNNFLIRSIFFIDSSSLIVLGTLGSIIVHTITLDL
jgi:hypothetical protein